MKSIPTETTRDPLPETSSMQSSVDPGEKEVRKALELAGVDKKTFAIVWESSQGIHTMMNGEYYALKSFLNDAKFKLEEKRIKDLNKY